LPGADALPIGGGTVFVLLEKIAGVALVTKLRAILLMEGNFNYMNKWTFGHEAINKLYALGYVPGD
jgi:hypothetical protein